jgi:ERF superfamily
MTAPRTARAKSAQEESDETAAIEQAASSDSAPLPNVHVAIARVASDIGAIAKEQQVTAGPARFKFRGVDDVLNAIHEPLCRHGVSIVPTGFDVLDQTVGVTKSGTAQQHLLGVVKFRILGPAGDYVDIAVVAEAQDTSDKAASKMMSMAYKYAAFQTFSIPVEGALEESDRDSSPREVNHAGPQVTIEDVHNRIKAAAESLGTDMKSITSKFRETHGGLTMEEFMALPVDKVFPFAQQVVQYANQQAARMASTESAPDA